MDAAAVNQPDVEASAVIIHPTSGQKKRRGWSHQARGGERLTSSSNSCELVFSESALPREQHGAVMEELSPRLFPSTLSYGACPHCHRWIGHLADGSPELVVPDPQAACMPAIAPWSEKDNLISRFSTAWDKLIANPDSLEPIDTRTAAYHSVVLRKPFGLKSGMITDATLLFRCSTTVQRQFRPHKAKAGAISD